MRILSNHHRRLRFEPLEARLVLDGTTLAAAGVLDLIEGADDPAAQVIAALVQPKSGITVVADSVRFAGRVGNGSDSDTAQSALFSPFTLSPTNLAYPTAQMLTGGVLLTSGIANLQNSTSETGFGTSVTGMDAADDIATIQGILANSESVADINLIKFDFTIAPGKTSIEADFIFGTDEYSEYKNYTDIFAFIVDGTNYARFSDNSNVGFVGESHFNPNDGDLNSYAIEYDGITKRLHISALIDPNVGSGGVHTVIIAIADTRDSVVDSGVFISRLTAGKSTQGGIQDIPDPVPIVDTAVVSPGVDLVPRQTSNSFFPPDPASLLLVTLLPVAPIVTATTEYGTSDAYVSTDSSDFVSPSTPPVIDAALASDEIDSEFLLASFLDFVDPEMLVVDLGDEPPSRVADQTAQAAVPATDKHDEGTGSGVNEQVAYMKPPLEVSVDEPVASIDASGLATFVAGHWKWIAGSTGALLLCGAGWKSRSSWGHAARKTRSR